MELTHRFTVPGSVGETWARFQDIGSLAECFPGATVTEVDGDTFKGTVKVKLGPIALVYAGSGTFTEKDETAHRLVVDAKGRDKRGNGTAGATATLTMADAGGSTDVEVHTDLNVTGKPAQFGRGVMQDVSDKLLGQFTDCLERQSSAEPAEPASDASSAPVEAESEASPPPVEPASAASGAETNTSSSKSTPADDDAIDLGRTVLPAILKNYGVPIAIVVIAVVLLIVFLL